jgi:hypothetical protein
MPVVRANLTRSESVSHANEVCANATTRDTHTAHKHRPRQESINIGGRPFCRSRNSRDVLFFSAGRFPVRDSTGSGELCARAGKKGPG